MDALFTRTENKCELCASKEGLALLEVSPSDGSVDQSILTCKICRDQINGAQLAVGDAITLIKDSNVKGAGFTAKRGTTVRNISLDQNKEHHIEGRVNGQQIVILTEFVKKA